MQRNRFRTFWLIAVMGLGSHFELQADSAAAMHDHQSMPDHRVMHDHGSMGGHGKEQTMVTRPIQPADAHETVTVGGEVIAVLPEQRQLKVRHDAIEAWQMGPMQMRFEVAPPVSLDGVYAGKRIQFRLRREGIGRFRILTLQ